MRLTKKRHSFRKYVLKNDFFFSFFPENVQTCPYIPIWKNMPLHPNLKHITILRHFGPYNVNLGKFKSKAPYRPN